MLGHFCQSDASPPVLLLALLTSSYKGLGRLLGPQEIQAPRISKQSAHEGGKAVSHMHRPPVPPGDISGTHFF